MKFHSSRIALFSSRLPSAFRRSPLCSLPSLIQRRFKYTEHGLPCLSQVWIPTGGITPSSKEDSHALLVRAGFLRQAHAGIFQLLPLGVRVQEKLERLIDKHMSRIGASKLSLSTLSSEELWKRSGRLDKSNQELFHVEDRKGAKFLLSPTHEEEITSLVGEVVKSYKDLPLRVYQITRKYRDELRPRQGLLRGREFLMKDLYTFDISREDALSTYQDARDAYNAFFVDLKLPYMVAEADSGNIGGDLSHEYHLPSDQGEDLVVQCTDCGYAVNEEMTGEQVIIPEGHTDTRNLIVEKTGLWRGITRDRSTIVEVVYPKSISLIDDGGRSHAQAAGVSTIKIKHLVPNVDLSVDMSPEDELMINDTFDNAMEDDANTIDEGKKILRFHDYRVCDQSFSKYSLASPAEDLAKRSKERRYYNLIKPRDGDPCTKCSQKSIKLTKAIELGHTFHLGTRYSEPLGLSVVPKPSPSTNQEPQTQSGAPQERNFLQMGCHGIGISRLIAAVASTLSDSKGLNWPSEIAPYQVVIIPRNEHMDKTHLLVDKINCTNVDLEGGKLTMIDTVIDDRDKDFVWKLNDADLVGYPIIVVIGRGWKDRLCEVQCRRLGIKEDVPLLSLGVRISEILTNL